MGSKTSGGTRKSVGGTFIQRSRAIGAKQKAQFHQIDGAGRGKVRRPFFDLTDADVAEIETRVGLHLDVVVKKAG